MNDHTLPIPGPLTLGDLLDRAFRLYRARFGTLVAAAAAILAPVGIISGLLMGRSLTGYMASLEALSSIESSSSPSSLSTLGPFFGGMAGLLGMSLLVGAVALVATALLVVTLAHVSIEALHGRRATLGDSLRLGVRRLWPMILLEFTKGLLIFFAILVVMVPLFILATVVIGALGLAAGLGGGGSTGSALAGVGIVLMLICGYGFALLLAVVPVAYLSARWIASEPGLVAQGWGPIDALRGSWRLTRGRTWRSLGYVILLYVLAMLVTGIPAAIVQQVMVLALGPSQMGLTYGLSQAVSTLAGILWQPLMVAALVLYYYDLRVRGEGYDLALRVQQFAMQSGVATAPPLQLPSGEAGAGPEDLSVPDAAA